MGDSGQGDQIDEKQQAASYGEQILSIISLVPELLERSPFFYTLLVMKAKPNQLDRFSAWRVENKGRRR